MPTPTQLPRTNYILIDLENVQPDNLDLLIKHDFKVMVFVGANQAKITFELAAALQALGKRAEYIKISGNGPNALDFHIAYYIGQIAATDTNSYFHIISKDTGFDPLLHHLKTRKIKASRHSDVANIPLLKAMSASNLKEQTRLIIEFLHSRGNAKPATLTTLSNSIDHYFRKTLSPQQIDELIAQLTKPGYIRVENKKLIYKLPKSAECEPA